MKPGDRIRVNERSAWPERVSRTGVIVDPAIFNGTYPGDKPFRRMQRHEAIVLLDDDPLMSGESRARDWSCVMDLDSLEPEKKRSEAQ